MSATITFVSACVNLERGFHIPKLNDLLQVHRQKGGYRTSQLKLMHVAKLVGKQP